MDKTLSFSEKGHMNRKFLDCYGIIAGVLIVAYFVELVKGNRTPGYIAVFCLILLLPLISCIFLYRKNKESGKIKYLGVCGYCVLYAFVLLTSTSHLSFCYILPMTVAVMLFQDSKFALKAGILSVLVNAADIALLCSIQGGPDKSMIVNYEIRIAVIVLVVAISIIVTNALERVSNYRLGLIEDEKEKGAEVLSHVLSTVEALVKKVSEIDEEAKK